MTLNSLITEDQSARIEALDPTRSFIVQAPAGSGKTELLTQRFLKLLALSPDTPEQIVAITFTRKAAAEMRDRVIKASSTIKNPHRLRILTIDSLVNMINHFTPLLSQFGANPTITTEPQRYYQQAVQNLLMDLNPQQPWSTLLEKLLLHLHNNTDRLENLCIQLLSRRDEWLPHLIPYYHNIEALRSSLEQGLQRLIEETLKTIDELMLPIWKKELIELLPFTGYSLTQIHSVSDWKKVSQLLLTKEGEWRRQYDKRSGFKPEEKALKQRCLDLIAEMKPHESLKQTLAAIQELPPATYSDSQWEIIVTLVKLLPLLAAELQLVFKQQGCVDFTEQTLGALRALGTPENPTDLALHLDYRIQHILVDEFQDTSMIQFELLERLTAGWQPNDGRTLFLVGDPMQSIYRFRNAEVGLFIRAQRNGIGQIPLKSLKLHLNFRSNTPMIQWINQTFVTLFPEKADMTLGAIPYTPSEPSEKAEKTGYIEHYLVDNPAAEANKMIQLISQLSEKNPNETIGILVRSRYQLLEIIPKLQEAKFHYQAMEIETLSHQSEIQDLLSLLTALNHLSDRIAWLSILRAPWCGLTLKDLHALSSYHPEKPLWFSLQHYTEIKALSQDARQRLDHIVPVLQWAFHQQHRKPLTEWLMETWIYLGGPTYLNSLSTLNNVESFFNLIESMTLPFEINLLKEKLSKLYADTSTSASAKIHIMTIHKAKGLEFDHVILPGLHRRTPGDTRPLLRWLERPSVTGSNDLLLGPLSTIYKDPDAIYDYLQTVEKAKLDYEFSRLFYVATTRTKKSLHLFYENKSIDTGFLKLLASNDATIVKSDSQKSNGTENSSIILPKKLQRLSSNKQHLTAISDHLKIDTTENPINSLSITEMMQKARQQAVGTLSHEILQKVAQEGLHEWNEDKINAHKRLWERRLLQLGGSTEDSGIVIEAITSTLQDQRGQWILSPHPEAQNEFALTLKDNSEITHHIIDRTFCENGIRWIIDYKISNAGRETHVPLLPLYRSQLEQYAKILQQTDPRPIHLGLYFPLQGNWIHWEYGA